MPLPQGKLLASEETQVGVSTKFEQAMQDLALKGERQRAQKAKDDAAAHKKEQEEKAKQPLRDRLAYQKEAASAYGSVGAAEQAEELEEYEGLLDDDTELDKLRHARLEQIRKQKKEYIENKAKGHGEYSEILEEEFLKTVLNSKFCVVHFYHTDFERCKIMDMHLGRLAPNHVEARFVKINADKSRFFVEKLSVRTLPTVLFFMDGKVIDKLIGFQGLGNGRDEFKTRQLEERIGLSGVIKMEKAFYEETFEEKSKETKRDIMAFEDEFSSDEEGLWD